MGTPQVPLRHFRLASQSVAPPHSLPSVQGTQVLPPQSTSVSVAFLAPSVQLGAWQTLDTQLPDAQLLAA